MLVLTDKTPNKMTVSNRLSWKVPVDRPYCCSFCCFEFGDSGRGVVLHFIACGSVVLFFLFYFIFFFSFCSFLCVCVFRYFYVAYKINTTLDTEVDDDDDEIFVLAVVAVNRLSVYSCCVCNFNCGCWKP